jgi:hypothetical protein
MKMKSTAKSSSLELNASRRPSKLGDMLAQKKIKEARRLTPEQRLLVALELSDAVAALHRVGSKKR